MLAMHVAASGPSDMVVDWPRGGDCEVCGGALEMVGGVCHTPRMAG
jgi:hypothetical protein